MDVIDLPEGVESTFRDVAREPDGEILIIATDGALHSRDPNTEGLDVQIFGGTACMTDPAAKKIHAVEHCYR